MCDSIASAGMYNNASNREAVVSNNQQQRHGPIFFSIAVRASRPCFPQEYNLLFQLHPLVRRTTVVLHCVTYSLCEYLLSAVRLPVAISGCGKTKGDTRIRCLSVRMSEALEYQQLKQAPCKMPKPAEKSKRILACFACLKEERGTRRFLDWRVVHG